MNFSLLQCTCNPALRSPCGCLVCGCILGGYGQDSVFISEKNSDDVFETGAREGIRMPALHHEVVNGPGASRWWWEAISIVYFLCDL